MPGNAGMVVPNLDWPGGFYPSTGSFLAPISSTGRVPQVFREHHISQRMCCPAGDDAPTAPVAPLAMNYSPECWSKPVTSGNCADTEQTAWDNTFSLFVTFTSPFHRALILLTEMCREKGSASLR